MLYRSTYGVLIDQIIVMFVIDNTFNPHIQRWTDKLRPGVQKFLPFGALKDKITLKISKNFDNNIYL